MGDELREQRQGWAYEELTGRVEYVTGYRCTPANPDYWWVPGIGYSLPDARLFADQREALRYARSRIEEEQAAVAKKWANWEAQVAKQGSFK